MPPPPKKKPKKKRPADKPPKKGATQPPLPQPKPLPRTISESYNRAVKHNEPVVRNRFSKADVFTQVLTAIMLHQATDGGELAKSIKQRMLIEQYLALEVPGARAVEVRWEEKEIQTEVNGSPATVHVPIRGTFHVARVGDPPGLRNPGALVVRRTIIGNGPTTELPDEEYMVDAILLAKDAEYAGKLVVERTKPVMSKPDRREVSDHLLDVLNTAIDEYLDTTKRTEGGGGGGGGDAALAQEDVERVRRELPKPEIIDLPLPEHAIGVASTGGGRRRAAAAGVAEAGPRARVAGGPDPFAPIRTATWQAQQHVIDTINGLRPAPPPIPSHPGFAKAPSQHIVFDGLRKLAGKPLKDGAPLWNLHRALVGELGEKGPIRTVAKDADGDRTWVEMLLAGRFRSPAESAQAGDLVVVADAAGVDGGYPAVVVHHDANGPREWLVAQEWAPKYHVVEVPPTATVLDAWVPRPSHALSDTAPIGAFWGPGMKRMRAMLQAYVGGHPGVDELVAAIAAGIKRKASRVGELLAIVADEAHIAGPGTPMYPGAVVFGRDDEVGVVLSDGSVLGVSEVGRHTNLPEIMRLVRFVPNLVWYPSPPSG
jgi:hypothetical protein